MGRSRVQKLWCIIEDILTDKVSRFGIQKKYHVKLVGVTKELWVHEKQLSAGVAECYQAGLKLPKKAKAYVDRGYSAEQKKFIHEQRLERRRLSPDDPVKDQKRAYRWAVDANAYVGAINKVLKLSTRKRSAARKIMITELNPPKTVLGNLHSSNFINGAFVIWNSREDVLTTTSDKPGFLTCTVCEKNFKWARVERALCHVTSARHYDCCKQKLNKDVTDRSANLMTDVSKSVLDGSKLVHTVQDYALQYCVAKSLPFTAAVMALDCVSAAVTTLTPGGISRKSIDHLRANGFRDEANFMQRMSYVSTFADGGGRRVPKKRACEREKPRAKRSRLRLHRTSIAKRVNKLADRVKLSKFEFLHSCPYVGLIVDEGNNYRRSCPLYAATISCDFDFNWSIQFIGQANCEGKKDGESIFRETKNIFIDNGLDDVFERFSSVGTDGASVMRSTIHFRGLDCRGTTGRSFSAFMKRDIKEDLEFWHCLCHQLNLSLNDALDAIKPLKSFFVPHLRMCHSEFKRSSTNRAELSTIREEMKQQFDHSWDFKIFYPKIFCLTRWVGLHTCVTVLSKRSNRRVLKRYVQRLRERGFGPRDFDAYKYTRRRQ